MWLFHAFCSKITKILLDELQVTMYFNVMQIIYESFVRWVHGCVHLVLPPLCVVTGEIVERQGMISSEAWRYLDFVEAPMCKTCGIPFGYEIEEGAECGTCLKYPPAYDSARAALVYNDGSRGMILGFKHADRTYHVLAFAPLLLRAGADMLSGADVIVPVPLHPLRLLSRRYNQAGLLAQSLAEELNVPCLVAGLERVRATKSQGHMKFSERRNNVTGAFRVPAGAVSRLEGARVVLVDDVYTTGATVNECAKILKAAGAVRVDVLTLARTTKDGMV